MTADDEAEIWEMLARGAADRRAPFHLMTVATVDRHGAPALRMVVLRRVGIGSRELGFHSDARSPKVAELRRRPEAALLFWDPLARLQLRCAVIAAIHTQGPGVEAVWERLNAGQQSHYFSERPPGTPMSAPATADGGRAAFCLVDCAVRAIDALWLREGGHRRVVFDYNGRDPVVVTPVEP